MKYKRIIRITANTLAITLAAVSLLLSAFVLISRAKGETPFLFGRSCMWLVTDSMSPTIREKSYILVEKVNAEDARVGDIIVYISDDPEILGLKNTHRVVEIVENGKEFVTKGDNNTVKDQYNAKAEKLVAKYVKTLPFISILGRLFSSAAGISALSILLFTVFFLLLIPQKNLLTHPDAPDIAAVEITLDPPLAGKPACFEVTLPEKAAYRAESLKWLMLSGSGTSEMPDGGTFAADGTQYSVCITLEPAKPHSFAEQCTAAVNGTPALAEPCGKKLIVMFSFGAAKEE